MRALTNTLQHIWTVVSKQFDVLPAAEGATEEMTYIDAEERDDTRLAGDNVVVDSILEVPKPDWQYHLVRPIPRSEKHFFRYFLDGSYRHYFLATGLEHDRATPIFLAQIAIVIVERDDAGKLSVEPGFRRHQWFLLMAKSQVSDTAWKQIEQSTREAEIPIVIKDLAEGDHLGGGAALPQELRERGRSKTRYIMSQLEFDLVTEFKTAIPDGWMIKDGIISWGVSGSVMKAPGLIGVSKQFTTVQQFSPDGGKTRKRESVASLLCGLPEHHRTPAYEGYDGQSAFWYVRLRKSQQLLYPLFGVVKVQIPVIEEQPLTTELLDEVTGALLAEQFVTPYGSDDRWHSHLYPIYQAEHAAKGLFSSTEVIQGCINCALRSR
jgi:hypothetical protein